MAVCLRHAQGFTWAGQTECAAAQAVCGAWVTAECLLYRWSTEAVCAWSTGMACMELGSQADVQLRVQQPCASSWDGTTVRQRVRARDVRRGRG